MGSPGRDVNERRPTTRRALLRRVCGSSVSPGQRLRLPWPYRPSLLTGAPANHTCDAPGKRCGRAAGRLLPNEGQIITGMTPPHAQCLLKRCPKIIEMFPTETIFGKLNESM